jgi:hypothetical protein
MGNKEFAETLFTTRWVYRDGRWQFIHWRGIMAGMMFEPFKDKMSLDPPSSRQTKIPYNNRVADKCNAAQN